MREEEMRGGREEREREREGEDGNRRRSLGERKQTRK